MKFLVIGCGSIGSRHARNLARLAGIELLLYDDDLARTRSLAEELGATVVRDLDDGLGCMPDAALICVPTHLHVPLALRALRAGAHLFVEKPISHTLDTAEELIHEVVIRKRLLLVGCNLRFHRPVSILKRWLDQGAIGRPLFGRFHFGHYLPNWRSQNDYRRTYSARSEMGGGILLEGVHEFDCARWFLGEPDVVSAMKARVSQLEIDTEDVVEILLRFASGAMAEIHLDYLRPVRGRAYELIGDEGMAVWRAEGKHPERSLVELHGLNGTVNERKVLDMDLNEMYVAEMRHFVQCLQGHETPALDGEGARRVLGIALAAREAAEEHRTIRCDRHAGRQSHSEA